MGNGNKSKHKVEASLSNESELKRMYWHSRRGMLELDLLLVPFVKERLPNADIEVWRLYRELLEEEDQDLFSWLVKYQQAPRESLQKVVDIILDGR